MASWALIWKLSMQGRGAPQWQELFQNKVKWNTWISEFFLGQVSDGQTHIRGRGLAAEARETPVEETDEEGRAEQQNNTCGA